MKHVLGITGGIGSGKSLVCALLEERGIPVFYTDDEAKAEMRENADIHRDLIDLLGLGAISSDGQPVKAVLADYICRGPEYADNINKIVHPRVRERMHRWIEEKGEEPPLTPPQGEDSGARTPSLEERAGEELPLEGSVRSGASEQFLAIESALLFESGFNADCTATLAVTAPLEVRVSRIMRRDHITRAKALEWIGLQMPQEEKAALADHTIVNDGITPLTPQIDQLLSQLSVHGHNARHSIK